MIAPEWLLTALEGDEYAAFAFLNAFDLAARGLSADTRRMAGGLGPASLASSLLPRLEECTQVHIGRLSQCASALALAYSRSQEGPVRLALTAEDIIVFVATQIAQRTREDGPGVWLPLSEGGPDIWLALRDETHETDGWLTLYAEVPGGYRPAAPGTWNVADDHPDGWFIADRGREPAVRSWFSSAWIDASFTVEVPDGWMRRRAEALGGPFEGDEGSPVDRRDPLRRALCEDLEAALPGVHVRIWHHRSRSLSAPAGALRVRMNVLTIEVGSPALVGTESPWCDDIAAGVFRALRALHDEVLISDEAWGLGRRLSLEPGPDVVRCEEDIRALSTALGTVTAEELITACAIPLVAAAGASKRTVQEVAADIELQTRWKPILHTDVLLRVVSADPRAALEVLECARAIVSGPAEGDAVDVDAGAPDCSLDAVCGVFAIGAFLTATSYGDAVHDVVRIVAAAEDSHWQALADPERRPRAATRLLRAATALGEAARVEVIEFASQCVLAAAEVRHHIGQLAEMADPDQPRPDFVVALEMLKVVGRQLERAGKEFAHAGWGVHPGITDGELWEAAGAAFAGARSLERLGRVDPPLPTMGMGDPLAVWELLRDMQSRCDAVRVPIVRLPGPGPSDGRVPPE